MASLLYLLVATLLLAPLLCHATDPDPLQDFCVADLGYSLPINGFVCKPDEKVVSSDFFFKGLRKEGDTSNPLGSKVTLGNVLAFPGLNTLGISMNRLDLAPGGLNPPHTHPRATESGVVIEGEVLVGFVSTGGVLYSQVLHEGDMFVVPRGLIHFEKNMGKGKAKLITAFNSQNPGAVVLPMNLFGSKPPIPDDILAQAYQVHPRVIRDIAANFRS